MRPRSVPVVVALVLAVWPSGRAAAQDLPNPLSLGDAIRGVNCLPEDAKWVFRWSSPEVVYDPGMLDVTVSGEDSTRVEVIEG